MFAAVYLPDFALQSILRHDSELQGLPVALLQDDAPKSPVWQVTASARQLGISPGLNSTQAKARCSSIIFRTRSLAQEEAAQEILLECGYQAAAFIESTSPGICTIDLRGLALLKAEPLEPALQFWSSNLRERLAQFHLNGTVGIARAPGLALQAAQDGRDGQIVFDAQKFQAALPLTSLSMPAELLEITRRWGIHTVAEFLALTKFKVAERLGAEGLKFFEQAQADHIRPLKLTSPKLIIEESFHFEQPIETLEPLLFIVRRHLEQLSRRVAQSSAVVEELKLSLLLESGLAQERTLKIPAPTRDVEALFRILHNYLETVRTRSAVSGLKMQVKPCRSETEQFQLFETAVRDPNRFYETVGRLEALLGADRVGRPVLRDSHRPDFFAIESITSHDEKKAQSGEPKLKIQITAAKPVPRGLLLRRLRPPRPASVRLREGHPVFVRSEGLSSSILRSQGPWRRSGDWWENVWSREEWDVETKDGGLYRIFREGSEWFLEGALD